MLFNSVRPDYCAGGEAQSGLGRCLMLVGALTFSTAVTAGWQDPLQTPAMTTSKAHQGLLLDITDAGERLVSVGAHGHIIYSDDQGMNWQQGQVPVTVTLTATDFANDRHGWVVGHDGVILHSGDGAITWEKQFDGFLANKAMMASAEENLAEAEARAEAVAGSGSDLEIDQAMTALETAQFALQDAEYDLETGSTKPFLDVYFSDENTGMVVGAYGMAFETEDGGRTWKEFSSRLPNPNRLHMNRITRVGESSLVITGEMGLMLRSDDMGKNWVALESPYEGSLFGLEDMGDYQLLFALRGHLFRSEDDGISWTALEDVTEQTLLGATSGDRGAMLVGNGGAVVTLDSRFNNPSVNTIQGRKGLSAVIRSRSGYYVVAGEAGIQLVGRDGALADKQISMIAGGE